MERGGSTQGYAHTYALEESGGVQATLRQEGNAIYGLYQSKQTVAETGAAHQSGRDPGGQVPYGWFERDKQTGHTFTFRNSGNSATGKFNSRQVGRQEQTLSETASHQLTNDFQGGTTLRETKSDDYTLSGIGNGSSVFFGRNGVSNQTFGETGASTAGRFTISQQSTKPAKRTETLFLADTRFFAREKVSNAQHAMTEIGANLYGDPEPFSLTETNKDKYTLHEIGAREKGDYYADQRGLQTFTLRETGVLGANNNFDTTVRGQETYNLNELRNHASGYFLRQLRPAQGNITYERQSQGLPNYPDDTYLLYNPHKMRGNALHGNLEEDEFGGRFATDAMAGGDGVIPRFINPANSDKTAGSNDTNPGSADFRPVGAPFVAAFGSAGVRLPADYSGETGPSGEAVFKEMVGFLDSWYRTDQTLPGILKSNNAEQFLAEIEKASGLWLAAYVNDNRLNTSAAGAAALQQALERGAFDSDPPLKHTVQGLFQGKDVYINFPGDGSVVWGENYYWLPIFGRTDAQDLARIQGVQRAAGAVVVGGTTWWTGIGAAYALDEGLTGLKQAFSGRPQHSVLEQDLMNTFGLSPQDAALVSAGFGVALTLGAGWGSMSAALRTPLLVGIGAGGLGGLSVTGDWRGFLQEAMIGSAVALPAYGAAALGYSALVGIGRLAPVAARGLSNAIVGVGRMAGDMLAGGVQAILSPVMLGVHDWAALFNLTNQGIQRALRPMHHIATHWGPWERVFSHIFAGARMTLGDGINLIAITSHEGPHGLYNMIVYDRLLRAVENLRRGSDAYRRAFRIELAIMRGELRNPSSELGALVRARASPEEVAIGRAFAVRAQQALGIR